MSNNITIWILGAGYMAREYFRVLASMKIVPIVITRGKKRAEEFNKEYNVEAICGGIEKALELGMVVPNFAIVATPVETLDIITKELLSIGVKNILVEKPAGLNITAIKEIEKLANRKRAKVYVAYNRRYYSSVEKAKEIIELDGGVQTFNFEFTEWGSTIAETDNSEEVKKHWMIANSTHIIDLAFYLGGYPQKMNSLVQGELDWHPCGSIYGGLGISKKGAIFTYQANWSAPGRWGLEVLTTKHRMYLRPIEKLEIQGLASLALIPVELDNTDDINFKPGLYKQVKAFINENNDGIKVSIAEHLEHMKVFQDMQTNSFDLREY